MKNIIWLVMIVAAWSCSGSSSKNEHETKAGDSILPGDPAPPAITARPSGPLPNEQIGNHINLTFARDSNSLTTTGHLDTAFSTVVCYLAVKQGSQLTASILPVKGRGNIRFNQVFLPNGNSDGPFGQTLNYPLKGPGPYKLNIGSSNMADSPYTGDFTLKVQVK